MGLFTHEPKTDVAKTERIEKLAASIAIVRNSDKVQEEDRIMAATWINKLYKEVAKKPRDTELLNIMAELTGQFTAQLTHSSDTLADPMDYHYTKLWIKAFSP